MRADLQQVYGVRLSEWLADRSRWGELLDLIDQLPKTSRTKAAMLNDPDVAREIVDSAGDGDPGKWSPAVADWTLEAELGAAMFDRLGGLIDTVAAALGGKSKSQAFPRPVTEVDRVKVRARREATEDLIALFGGRGTT